MRSVRMELGNPDLQSSSSQSVAQEIRSESSSHATGCSTPARSECRGRSPISHLGTQPGQPLRHHLYVSGSGNQDLQSPSQPEYLGSPDIASRKRRASGESSCHATGRFSPARHVRRRLDGSTLSPVISLESSCHATGRFSPARHVRRCLHGSPLSPVISLNNLNTQSLSQLSVSAVSLTSDEELRSPDISLVSEPSLAVIDTALDSRSPVTAGRQRPDYESGEDDEFSPMGHILDPSDEDYFEPEEMRQIEQLMSEGLLALVPSTDNANPGISSSEITQFVKEVICVGLQDETERCTICLESYGDGGTIGHLGCGHEYHASCIGTWIMDNPTCPLCKCHLKLHNNPV